jgi:DNA polymerase III epsilon subunit-like protein
MKYFIDFEATQYKQEIIQIGCVREDGQEFSSLIKPRKLKNVTRTITELTGITKEKLTHERSSDEVFEAFFEWLCTDKTPASFFCYGNADIVFVKNNMNKCTRDIKAQAALSMIAANLTDVSELVKEHFRLEKVPSLKKVMAYYFPKDEHICHDALSDAEMLRAVYDAMLNEEKIRGIPFPEHIGDPIFTNQEDLDRFVIVRSGNGQIETTYKTLDDAKMFIVELVKKQCRSEMKPENAQKKVLAAINGKKNYFGYSWVVKLKEI